MRTAKSALILTSEFGVLLDAEEGITIVARMSGIERALPFLYNVHQESRRLGHTSIQPAKLAGKRINLPQPRIDLHHDRVGKLLHILLDIADKAGEAGILQLEALAPQNGRQHIGRYEKTRRF